MQAEEAEGHVAVTGAGMAAVAVQGTGTRHVSQPRGKASEAQANRTEVSMGDNKAKDSEGPTPAALEKRIEELAKGLRSAIGYMNTIGKAKWVPRPDALIAVLNAIMERKG